MWDNRRNILEKTFETSLILGRFNHIHNGHKMLIDMSRKISKKTLILIGSSNKSGTLRNPYNVKLRKEIIEKIYGNEEDIIIAELADLTNENDITFEWGRYLLNNAEKIIGQKPDLMIYGKDESRKGWFYEEDIKNISEIVVSRDKIQISATKLREYLVHGNFEEWSKFVPKEIHDEFDILREELLKVDEYKNMI